METKVSRNRKPTTTPLPQISPLSQVWRCVPGAFTHQCLPSTTMDPRKEEKLENKEIYTYYPSVEECEESCASLPVDIKSSVMSFLSPKDISLLRSVGKTSFESVSQEVLDNN